MREIGRRLSLLTATPPGAAGDRLLRARVLAFMFVVGGLTAFGAFLLSSGLTELERALFIAAASAAVVAGPVVWLRGARMGDRETGGFLAVAAAIVTLGVYASAGDPFGASIFYAWVAGYGGYYFTLRVAFAHTAAAALMFATVLVLTDTPGADWGWWVSTTSTMAVAVYLLAVMKAVIASRVADLERTANALAESNALRGATLEATADAILVVDDDGKVLSHNRNMIQMWDLAPGSLDSADYSYVSHALLDRLDGAAPEAPASALALGGADGRLEDDYAVLRRSDGRVCELHVRPRTTADGEPRGWVLSFRDITEREQIQSQLRHMTHHDPLTGLMNRSRIEEEIERHIGRETRYGAGGAVVILNIDEFKHINDALGLRPGDAVLTALARLLQSRLRSDDAIARLGGDEFAVLLPEADLEEAKEMAEALVAAVRASTATYQGSPIRFTVSAGVAAAVAPTPEGGVDSAEAILVRAGLAMYEAKEAGRDRVCVHGRERTRVARRDATRTWADRIREALEGDGFVVHAQPILDIGAHKVTQYELLVRMPDEDGPLLPPSRFLPAAERSGLIAEVDRWVVGEAVDCLRSANRAGIELQLEVNLSSKTIDDPNLPEFIEDRIGRAGVSPADLVFEITETAAVRNLDEAQRFAEKICALGCRFALDDFGAGFGSFYYLKYLPFDYLKIDGDFISNVLASNTDQAVVRAIVDLAVGLDKRTIAEFVGDVGTLRLLSDYGVDFAQGNFIGPPRPLEELLTRPAVAPVWNGGGAGTVPRGEADARIA